MREVDQDILREVLFGLVVGICDGVVDYTSRYVGLALVAST